jgi:hypothetical protein
VQRASISNMQVQKCSRRMYFPSRLSCTCYLHHPNLPGTFVICSTDNSLQLTAIGQTWRPTGSNCWFYGLAYFIHAIVSCYSHFQNSARCCTHVADHGRSAQHSSVAFGKGIAMAEPLAAHAHLGWGERAGRSRFSVFELARSGVCIRAFNPSRLIRTLLPYAG